MKKHYLSTMNLLLILNMISLHNEVINKALVSGSDQTILQDLTQYGEPQ